MIDAESIQFPLDARDEFRINLHIPDSVLIELVSIQCHKPIPYNVKSVTSEPAGLGNNPR